MLFGLSFAKLPHEQDEQPRLCEASHFPAFFKPGMKGHGIKWASAVTSEEQHQLDDAAACTREEEDRPSKRQRLAKDTPSAGLNASAEQKPLQADTFVLPPKRQQQLEQCLRLAERGFYQLLASQEQKQQKEVKKGKKKDSRPEAAADGGSQQLQGHSIKQLASACWQQLGAGPEEAQLMAAAMLDSAAQSTQQQEGPGSTSKAAQLKSKKESRKAGTVSMTLEEFRQHLTQVCSCCCPSLNPSWCNCHCD
jgi:hypothetical protein